MIKIKMKNVNGKKLKEVLVDILKEMGRGDLVREVFEVLYDAENKEVTIFSNSVWMDSRSVKSLKRLSKTVSLKLKNRGVVCEKINVEPPTGCIDEGLRSLGFQKQIHLYNLARDAPPGERDVFFKAGSYIPLIDMLRFVPKFQKEIESSRKRLGVEPKEIIDGAIRKLGNGKWHYYKRHVEWHRHHLPPIEEVASGKFEGVEKELQTYEKRRFPELKREVAKIRYRKIKGLVEVWQRAIERYVLYDLVSSGEPFFYRKGRTLEVPKIKLELDRERLEPYLEIRVYSNTDLTFFKKVRNIKEAQKLIPTYKNINDFDEQKSVSRFWYFLLRTRLKLTHTLASGWLEDKGFEAPEDSHASQHINRFLNLFGKTSKK